MKLSLTLVVLISTFLFSSILNAQQGWSTNTRIFDLGVFNGNSIFAQAIDINVSAACPEAGSEFQLRTFRLDTENPFFKETYSILLAAQASGREVQIHRTGECHNGALAIINGARLRN